MELSRLTNLCKALGRSDVKEGEEWKTLKYVHTPGQGSPAVDVEILLNRKQITLVNDAAKAGFCITEPLYSDIVIPINEDDVDVTTFLDLNHITDLSFLVDDDIVDIYDVVNKLNETSFPIRIGFKTDPTTEFDGENPIFKFKTAKDIKIGYNLSRHLKAGTDYKITFKKERGKNLLPYPYYETTLTRDGITFTDNGDGSITVNGTATANTRITLTNLSKKGKIVSKGRYVLNANLNKDVESGNCDLHWQLMKGGNAIAQVLTTVSPATMTTTNIEYDWDNIFIYVSAGTTVNNIVFRPQLESGHTAAGEIIDKITEPGVYTLTIAGIGKYIGSKTCKIIVDPKL